MVPVAVLIPLMAQAVRTTGARYDSFPTVGPTSAAVSLDTARIRLNP